MTAGIDPDVAPSGPGCVECEAAGGGWVHLRRCAQCGHVGCCDSSPSQHATAHFEASGHPVMQSYEPGEDWFWDFARSVGWTGRGSPTRRADPRASPCPCPCPLAASLTTGATTCTDLTLSCSRAPTQAVAAPRRTS